MATDTKEVQHEVEGVKGGTRASESTEIGATFDADAKRLQLSLSQLGASIGDHHSGTAEMLGYINSSGVGEVDATALLRARRSALEIEMVAGSVRDDLQRIQGIHAASVKEASIAAVLPIMEKVDELDKAVIEPISALNEVAMELYNLRHDVAVLSRVQEVADKKVVPLEKDRNKGFTDSAQYFYASNFVLGNGLLDYKIDPNVVGHEDSADKLVLTDKGKELLQSAFALEQKYAAALNSALEQFNKAVAGVDMELLRAQLVQH